MKSKWFSYEICAKKLQLRHALFNRIIYIVMELCDGGNLSTYIKRHRTLPECTCKFFMKQLASALQYMRSNNVCHFDLKPQNLLLVKSPVLALKVADFGWISAGWLHLRHSFHFKHFWFQIRTIFSVKWREHSDKGFTVVHGTGDPSEAIVQSVGRSLEHRRHFVRMPVWQRTV